jgi:hypothetical protein
MGKYIFPAVIAVILMALSGCGKAETASSMATGETPAPSLGASFAAPLEMAALPSSGYIKLDSLSAAGLDTLGLGGPSPAATPPSSPFNQYGMYWSEPFSLVKGDTVRLTVYSDAPVSWFGVDWKTLDVRGILATTELDEDGRTFNPQYPADSAVEQNANGYKMTVNYKITHDADCVLVVKNLNPDSSQRISLSLSLKPSLSFTRMLRNVPVLKNLVEDKDEMEEGDF